jgi:hypothetical protein
MEANKRDKPPRFSADRFLETWYSKPKSEEKQKRGGAAAQPLFFFLVGRVAMERAVKGSREATTESAGKKKQGGSRTRTGRSTAARRGAGKRDSAEGVATAAQQDAAKARKVRPVRDIQRHADIETRRAFPEICEALLEHARKGAMPQTKLLIKIGKLDEKAVPARQRRGKSLSAMLMQELERRKEEAATDAASAVAEAGTAAEEAMEQAGAE